jgi:hypothetical protein
MRVGRTVQPLSYELRLPDTVQAAVLTVNRRNGPSPKGYWWRNRPGSSSSFFHEASKVRKRSSMWGNAFQPVMQSAHIHGCCGQDTLKMGPRFSDVA